MVHLSHPDGTVAAALCQGNSDIGMLILKKTVLSLVIVSALAFALGRMAVRLPLNALMGGTALGGNIL